MRIKHQLVPSATDGRRYSDLLNISADATSLSINSLTGVLSFVSAPDYETKQNYAAIVAASDGVKFYDTIFKHHY